MMRWSYSASRSFRQCQRQWFFKNVVASAKSKDPFRRRAYLLSKLQSISSWRGRIVDDVISNTVIPAINRRIHLKLGDAKRRARALFDRQLAFARRHPIANLNMKVSGEGDSFALFHVMEYGGQIPEQEIESAWDEIETALATLFTADDLKQLLKSAEYVVAQRSLQFPLMENVTALAVPDVIAFRKEAPPIVIDWKVHAFGQNDAWLQLAIYAIALGRCKAHADFPEGFAANAHEIELYEAQLLTKVVRRHLIEEAEITEAEEYMLTSAYAISCLMDGQDYADLRAEDFRPAAHAASCERCAFRAICWEAKNVH
jgi:hypothetical protein